MSLQTFSLEVLQKVRQHIRGQLALPPSEMQPLKRDTNGQEPTTSTVEPTSLDALGDLFRVGGFMDEDAPAPNAEGRWFISTIDPAAAVNKLPGLSVKSGVRLITYLQRQQSGGMGVTWALPDLMSTTARLEDALEAARDSAIPPHPDGALGHIMDGIQGDQSPASFVAASLLLRELKEVGRTGQNCRWSHHRLIAGVPPNHTWKWRTKAPTDFSPKIKIQDDRIVLVEFFTCRIASPIAIFRHFDQYTLKSYRPKTNDQVIAILEKHVTAQS